jgi:hypothetical protein
MGGKVKGYKVGGSPGMHRMPDGKMMKDSAHKGKPERPAKPKKVTPPAVLMKYEATVVQSMVLPSVRKSL